MKLRDVEVWRILKVYRKLEKIYREVDVKEKFHHRKNKRIKETIYARKKSILSNESYEIGRRILN